MLDRMKIALQNILPKLALTQLAGQIADCRTRWLSRMIIGLFVRYYRVDMQQAQQPELAAYPTFNAFFVRPLRDDARPIDTDPNSLVMPADGAISQLGPIIDDQIFQAKGHHYSLEALLAGNERAVEEFRDGVFVTTYLAPSDYHRVHMPCNGVLREMVYVPGSLYSVNPLTAAAIPNLFARNERVICLFSTEFGPMAQILVGATIVGSIETIWAGTVTPPREGIIKRWRYPPADDNGAVVLLKGQEMGRFKLGSTVVNLFAKGRVQLNERLYARAVTRVGERLAAGLALTAEDTKP